MNCHTRSCHYRAIVQVRCEQTGDERMICGHCYYTQGWDKTNEPLMDYERMESMTAYAGRMMAMGAGAVVAR